MRWVGEGKLYFTLLKWANVRKALSGKLFRLILPLITDLKLLDSLEKYLSCI